MRVGGGKEHGNLVSGPFLPLNGPGRGESKRFQTGLVWNSLTALLYYSKKFVWESKYMKNNRLGFQKPKR